MESIGQLLSALREDNDHVCVPPNDRADVNEETSPLLQLPDACLLKVLRCCADDPRTLFSAARAHSRLHQAAVQVASSIRTNVTQQTADSVLMYLTNHSQHVSSIDFEGAEGASQPLVTFHELPYSPQGLASLVLNALRLQLQPGNGYQGVLGAGAGLTQLHLVSCRLLDGFEGLAAALTLLPGLQHLVVTNCDSDSWQMAHFPSDSLQGLQQLTHLELFFCKLKDPDSLHHLRAMTDLQDLRLGIVSSYTDSYSSYSVKASMLSGLQQLTCLQLFHVLGHALLLEPGAPAGLTRLQHLAIAGCSYFQEGLAETAELLSHLQQLQQLTHLQLGSEGVSHEEPDVPAAAYSALTASSKLQHLDISCCMLPAGVWQHMFPAGRQLPHLQELVINVIRQPSGAAVAPEGSRLVSCCPGLQSLFMDHLQYNSELLAPLTGLCSLSELSLHHDGKTGQGFEVLPQLTGLRRLKLTSSIPLSQIEGLLLSLTKLQQLTHLELHEPDAVSVQLDFQGPDAASHGRPVWRQLLQQFGKVSDRCWLPVARLAMEQQDDEAWQDWSW